MQKKISLIPEKATEAEAVRVLGFSRRTLSEWRGLGAPHTTDGKRITYSLPNLVAWRLAHRDRNEQTRPPAEHGAAEISEALEEYRRHRAGQERIKLQRMEGSVYSKTDVDLAFSSCGMLLRTSLTEFVQRLPEKLAGRDVREIGAVLEREVNEVLNMVSDQLKAATGGRKEAHEENEGSEVVKGNRAAGEATRAGPKGADEDEVESPLAP
ncbi:MAG TPA: hypothetical protein VEK08_18610 [Planctomycetota bacterium]|nr:hypothetical protein [Planctomycetota bacterium]